MIVEKDWELFEQWWEDEGQYHRAGGNDYCKTFAWEAWIFAKAQAVPDGYVVVPKEPSANLVDHGHQVFLMKVVRVVDDLFILPTKP